LRVSSPLDARAGPVSMAVSRTAASIRCDERLTERESGALPRRRPHPRQPDRRDLPPAVPVRLAEPRRPRRRAAQFIVWPDNRDIAWFYGRAGARGRRCGGSRAYRTWPRVRRGRGRGAGREDQLGDRQASRRQAGRAWRPVRPGRMGERRYGLGLGRPGHRRYRCDAACLLGQRSRTQGINQSGALAWIGDDDYQLGEHRPAGPGCADLGRHCGHQHCLRSPPAPPAPPARPALTVAVSDRAFTPIPPLLLDAAGCSWRRSETPGGSAPDQPGTLGPARSETDDLLRYRGIAVRLG